MGFDHVRRLGRSLAPTLLAVLAVTSCTGLIGDADSDGDASLSPNEPASDGPEASYGPIEARRLSRHELANTLAHVVPVDATDLLDALSADPQTPFDNDYTTQDASTSLIEGVHLVARRLGERLLERRSELAAMLPCTPVGPDDDACLRSFIGSFGRRALRRPLSDDEIETYAGLGSYSVAEDDFLVGPSLVVSAVVQDLEFLYRIEIGEPVAGREDLRRLTHHEMASRMSYLFWGHPPDDALLEAADQGELGDAAGVERWALRMLDDDRARDVVSRFHALWLDYDRLTQDPVLVSAMMDETDALIGRVVFDDARPWTELFTAEETFIGPTLASHYGFDPVSTTGWVDYPNLSRRRGLLSHASFLSVGGKFDDTSPTVRGKNVLERLLCREIPAPPEGVDADEPPEGPVGSTCKVERYDMKDTKGCASCHAQTDPLGFGLENYGPDGAWRDVEVADPSCEVTGEGHLVGAGDFTGAGELGVLLAESSELTRCLTEQVYQFAVGRPPLDDELPLLDLFAEGFAREPDLRAFLVDYAMSDAFRFLRVTSTQ